MVSARLGKYTTCSVSVSGVQGVTIATAIKNTHAERVWRQKSKLGHALLLKTQYARLHRQNSFGEVQETLIMLVLVGKIVGPDVHLVNGKLRRAQKMHTTIDIVNLVCMAIIAQETEMPTTVHCLSASPASDLYTVRCVQLERSLWVDATV